MIDPERGELISRSFTPGETYGADNALATAYDHMKELVLNNVRLRAANQELARVDAGLIRPYLALDEMAEDLDENRAELITDIDDELFRASDEALNSSSLEDMGSVAVAYFYYLKTQYDGLVDHISDHPLLEDADVAILKLQSLRPGVPAIFGIDRTLTAGVVAELPEIYLDTAPKKRQWPANLSAYELRGTILVDRLDGPEELRLNHKVIARMLAGSGAINDYLDFMAPGCMAESRSVKKRLADLLLMAEYYQPDDTEDPHLCGEIDYSLVLS